MTDIHVTSARVTAAGVHVMDENGTEEFINFAACYKNYRARKSRWERLTSWLRVRSPRWKEIGQRDNGQIMGDPPTITLYTIPPTRLVFATLEDYEAARNAIWDAGWHTFDLT